MGPMECIDALPPGLGDTLAGLVATPCDRASAPRGGFLSIPLAGEQPYGMLYANRYAFSGLNLPRVH